MKKQVVKKTTKKEVTIESVAGKVDSLALMIESLAEATAKGFEKTSTKEELRDLEKKLGSRLDSVEFRLGRIETSHDRRIENLEDKMRILYTTFEKQLKIKLPK
jgi:hypothetical protein